MKISLESYLKSQRKTGLNETVEKHLANLPGVDESKTFHLSPTGGEIHSGESVVDRISKPETLREKVARFERLAQKVRENHAYMIGLGQEMVGEEDADDFDFEDGDFYDDFGDHISPIPEENAEIGEDKGESLPAPTAKADEEPETEPVSDEEK